MRLTPLIILMAALSLVGGCFDRDNDHPGRDSDPSKPSLQMQQPDTQPAPQPAPDPEPMPGQKPSQ